MFVQAICFLLFFYRFACVFLRTVAHAVVFVVFLLHSCLHFFEVVVWKAHKTRDFCSGSV